MNQAALDKMAELDRVYEERDALHHELKRSLTLQAIWPDAFTHGRCTTQVTGNCRRELTFTLKLGNGEMYHKPLEQVPTILWPETVKAEIRSAGYQARAVYKTMLIGEDHG